jgi:flagellar biosynthesis chaperone FliJ
MTRFHFPLQKVLDWRRTQLEIEEGRFRQCAEAVAAVDRARAELEAGAVHTECEVRRWDPVGGGDLRALGEYRAHVRAAETRLTADRAERARALAAQQAAMLEARRRFRLLERLKERRLAAWKSACDRELDEIASESFLAQWGSSGRRTL